MQPQQQNAPPEQNPVEKKVREWMMIFQTYLDKTSPLVLERWVALAVIIVLYFIRVWALRGFYIVTYILGIYNLNLFILFITPQFDPETDGPALPQRGDEEFKPFARKLPEFKAWWGSCRAFLIGLVATLIPAFDIPVYWPILLVYFITLVSLTMQRQIKHMVKHRYIPVSIGKKKYNIGVPRKSMTNGRMGA